MTKQVKKLKTEKSTSSMHPDHGAQKNRVKRIRGQIDGIDRMIDERRYCVEIIQQIKAARSALSALERNIVEKHLRSCVRHALTSKDVFVSEEKIQEIIKFIS